MAGRMAGRISRGEWLVEWLVELAWANGWNLAAVSIVTGRSSRASVQIAQ